MTFRIIFTCSFLAFLLLGCESTYQSFNKEIPDKFIEVIQDDPAADVEKTLKSSGKPYVCKELYYGHNSPKNKRACFIKLPQEDQIERLKIKMQGTPQAILLDTGKNVLIVGEVFLHALFLGYVPLD